MRYILGAETLAIVLGNEARVELATHELGVRELRGLEREVGADATNNETIQGFAHLGNRFIA
ncbi:MAG: hypothetical protein ACKOBA_11650, partial [Limnohabitans sp.]